MALQTLYIASSIGDSQTGIFVCRMDTDSGTLEIVQEVDAIPSCHYLNLHPNRQLLYATESGDNPKVHAFSVDGASGKLSYLNSQPTDGVSPCYVSVDHSGKYVLLVNYTGSDDRGSITVFPINDDGQLLPRSEYIQPEGTSIDPRQTCTHPHMITQTPDSRFVVVPDLGTDKVMVYRLNEGKLYPHDTPFISVAAGSGPRHLAFHPDEPYLYLINELGSTMCAYQYDTDKGIWSDIATVSTLPDDFEATTRLYPFDPKSGNVRREMAEGLVMHPVNHCADVHVHPNGKYLYGSNRGHNSIAMYELDTSTGRPNPMGHQDTLGEWPRNFGIDPTGQYLFVCNVWSDSIVVFKIDSATGKLEATSEPFTIPAPICIKFLVL